MGPGVWMSVGVSKQVCGIRNNEGASGIRRFSRRSRERAYYLKFQIIPEITRDLSKTEPN